MDNLPLDYNTMEKSMLNQKCSSCYFAQKDSQGCEGLYQSTNMESCKTCSITKGYSSPKDDHNFTHLTRRKRAPQSPGQLIATLPTRQSNNIQTTTNVHHFLPHHPRSPTHVRFSATTICVFILLSCLSDCVVVAKVVQTSTCRAWVDGRVINLEPLQRLDGTPRWEICSLLLFVCLFMFFLYISRSINNRCCWCMEHEYFL